MEFHIEDSGSGAPILFLHAGVADSRMWRDQMTLDGYRCIAFDQRGFGRTPFVAEPYSHRGDAVEVLDQLEIPSAVVVGCSIGASAAMQLAIENGNRVEGLVLVGAYPSGWVPPGGLDDNPLEEEAERAAEAGDFGRVLEIDYEMWLVGYGRTEDEIEPEVRELFMEMNRNPVVNQAERFAHFRPPDYKINDRLHEIDVATGVVVGAHDEDPILAASKYLADSLSDRDVVVIDGAAHLPSLEQPKPFNDALRSFLADI